MLTVQEALDVVFPSKLRGYRRDEVEALLSRLVDSLAESDPRLNIAFLSMNLYEIK